MKITTIGSGHIGGTLGKLWASKGHKIMFSSRNPQSEQILTLVKDAGTNSQAGTVEQGFIFGDVIILAIPPDDVEKVLVEAGDLHRKILINCTNRFDDKSSDAEVNRLAKNAQVVRAFNSLPWEVLLNPKFGSVNVSMFISGKDTGAKDVVMQLCHDIGIDPIDVGDSENSAQIEIAMGLLWKVLSPQFGRNFGLRILRHETSSKIKV